MPEETRGYGFPADKRLRVSREYRFVRDHGLKKTSRHFLIFICRTEAGFSRLGITASKKVGGAVQRNRVKRLVREFFRNHIHDIPSSTDISVIARKGAGELGYEQVSRELESLLQ